MPRLALQSIAESLVEPGTKGLPPKADALRLGDFGKQGWNVLRHDLPLPLAVLKDSALRHNSRAMRRFLEKTGSRLCPHGKTTMAPQLFQRQLEDGAWGITAATVSHVIAYRRFGVARIFFANQLVDPVGIDFVLEEMARDPDFDFYCLVDSLAGIDLLRRRAAARNCGRPLQVAVEVGVEGGRSGARSHTDAMALARAVHEACPLLALRGVEAFEGVFQMAGGGGGAAPKIEALTRAMKEVAKAADDAGLFADGPILLSAGGSAYFEQVASDLRTSLSRPVVTVLRSGCYLVHDHGTYEQILADPRHLPANAAPLDEPFRPALEVWGYVQSLPEPGIALLTMGKRDVSFDVHLPKPILWHRPGLHQQPQPLTAGYAISSLNDQHAFLACPKDHPLNIGDLVAVGISHPCTTFDKWQVLYLVDDDYTVIDGIRTYF